MLMYVTVAVLDLFHFRIRAGGSACPDQLSSMSFIRHMPCTLARLIAALDLQSRDKSHAALSARCQT